MSLVSVLRAYGDNLSSLQCLLMRRTLVITVQNNLSRLIRSEITFAGELQCFLLFFRISLLSFLKYRQLVFFLRSDYLFQFMCLTD
ncbi:hypothetical protein CSA37_01985 [Candidatus Fermentibacteria bacterium]|nr:MAG: hypothetical protein CSA37_01985 [Candidatus Fermentibacteria bacterium]